MALYPKNVPVFSSVSNEETSRGALAAFCAFTIWGMLPVYWKLFTHVSAVEVICHRGIWSFACLIPVVLYTHRIPEVLAALRGKNGLLLLCTSALLCVNWLIFIWAVANGHILETSLGSFMTPLFTMMFGVLFFRDTVTRLQWLSVILVAIAIAFRVAALGRFPWISLGVCATFALYGVIRKIISVESVPGLVVESMFLFPVSVGILVWFGFTGVLAFGSNIGISLLLLTTGIVTAIPMFLFAYGARHLKLTTLGVFHYIVPSFAFVLGVFVYDEPFNLKHFIPFAIIWGALVLYTFEKFRILAKSPRTAEKRQ